MLTVTMLTCWCSAGKIFTKFTILVCNLMTGCFGCHCLTIVFRFMSQKFTSHPQTGLKQKAEQIYHTVYWTLEKTCSKANIQHRLTNNIYYLGTKNVCTKCCANPSCRCWDTWQVLWKMWLLCGIWVSTIRFIYWVDISVWNQVVDQLNDPPCHSQSHANRTACYRHTIPPSLWLFKVLAVLWSVMVMFSFTLW